MHVSARPPGALDRRPEVRDQPVETLDEDERFPAPADIEAVLPHGAQVGLPGRDQCAAQPDDPRLHASFPQGRPDFPRWVPLSVKG